MDLKMTLCDTADYLTDPQSILHSLEGELEENETPFLARSIATVSRSLGGFDQLAAETGVAEDALTSSASKEDELEREMVIRLLEAFRRKMASTPMVA